MELFEKIAYRLKSWLAFSAIPAPRAQMYKKGKWIKGGPALIPKQFIIHFLQLGNNGKRLPKTGIKCVNLVKGLESFKTNFCAFSILKSVEIILY